MESELCTICPNYFNCLMVDKVSSEYLGIIWLFTDAFILFTVDGISNLSFICFFHPYNTAENTVMYSSLTFVLVETSKPSFFCQICICCFAQVYSFLGLFIRVAVIVIRITKTLQLVIVLLSSSSETLFTFSTFHITVVFCGFNLRLTIALLFLHSVISSIMSS